jgi:hypothetical protein
MGTRSKGKIPKGMIDRTKGAFGGPAWKRPSQKRYNVNRRVRWI